MFHKMDAQWPRQEHFEYYMNSVRCTYSLTVQVDITELKQVLKERGLKAYPVQIYMLTTIVNRFVEFRMGIWENREPGYWDLLHPSYTIFNNEVKTFSSIWTSYENGFKTFYQNCIEDMEKYKEATSFMPKPNAPTNIFSISSIPWIDFTAFDLNVYSDGTHLAPIFTIGKYIEKDGKVFMPIAMQLHHSACDGYHAGQFVESLRNMVEDYRNWL